jgi:hypothetical protein
LHLNLDHILPKIQINCISDGVGTTPFLKVVGEIAPGEETPTVPPVWNREISNFELTCDQIIVYFKHLFNLKSYRVKTNL